MQATIDGIRTLFEVRGREGAPWVTFSHSLACSTRMWEDQVRALGERFRILCYDTRGHGESSAPTGPYTLEALAGDLKGLLEHLGIERTHFVGLSMGGMIGQTFALRYPGVFSSLTLADTTSRYAPADQPLWMDRIRIAETQGMQPLVAPTLGRWFTAAFHKSHPDVVQRIGALIAATPVAGYAGCCHALPRIDATVRLKEIGCPILVLCGEEDPATPPAMAREIHAHAPGSKLVLIPGAAHLSNVEQPQAFNRALGEFLQGL